VTISARPPYPPHHQHVSARPLTHVCRKLLRESHTWDFSSSRQISDNSVRPATRWARPPSHRAHLVQHTIHKFRVVASIAYLNAVKCLSETAPMVGSAEKIGRLDARRFWWCGGEGLLGNNADTACYVCVRRFRAEGYTAFVLVIFDVVLLLRRFSDRVYRCSSALASTKC
jgi:hypothetical protein